MKHPAHPQLAHIIPVDLVQRTKPSPGIVSIVGGPIRTDWLGKQFFGRDINFDDRRILLGRGKVSRQPQAPGQHRLCKEVPSPAHEPFTPPYLDLGYSAFDRDSSIISRRSFGAKRDALFVLSVHAARSLAPRLVDGTWSPDTQAHAIFLFRLRAPAGQFHADGLWTSVRLGRSRSSWRLRRPS